MITVLIAFYVLKKYMPLEDLTYFKSVWENFKIYFIYLNVGYYFSLTFMNNNFNPTYEVCSKSVANFCFLLIIIHFFVDFDFIAFKIILLRYLRRKETNFAQFYNFVSFLLRCPSNSTKSQKKPSNGFLDIMHF